MYEIMPCINIDFGEDAVLYRIQFLKKKTPLEI